MKKKRKKKKIEDQLNEKVSKLEKIDTKCLKTVK